MIEIVGIDPSLTGTAVCLWSDGYEPIMKRHSSNAAHGIAARIKRYDELVSDVEYSIDWHVEKGEGLHIFLEGYSYGSKGSAILNIAEYGGLLRFRLLAITENVIEVPPSTLKKFATGKGNANKMAMALSCQKRWGVEYETDDEFDAYALARLGRVYVGLDEPETAFQREVVEELKHGKKAKRKKSNAV